MPRPYKGLKWIEPQLFERFSCHKELYQASGEGRAVSI